MDTRKFNKKIDKKKYEQRYQSRMKILAIVLLLALFILIGRLIELQVIHAETFKQKAERMRLKSNIHTYRGSIMDRNGIVLASDVTLYDIYAHPEYYKDGKKSQDEHIKEMATQIAPFLGYDVSKLEYLLKKPYSTITLARKVDKKTAESIRALKISGLDFAKRNERKYPQGMLASHILGYINHDSEISTGVEYTGKAFLDEIPDLPEVELDGSGKVIYNKDTNVNKVVSPPVGKDLTLTIDAKLQLLSEVELEKMIKDRKAEKGAVVMMNPKTGELLAFAVYPKYDPNHFRSVDYQTIKNWAVTDVYPPGSTFKIITLAAGLETGVISRYSKIEDTGKMSIQGWTIYNYDYYKHGAPGFIDLHYLLEHSSNIASAKIALMMDPKKHRDLLLKFGMGSKTGIDIPGESSGLILPLDKWDNITRATIAYGYGLASTPIQMASAIAAIANKGIWVTPHLIKYPKDLLEKKIKRRRVLSSRVSNTVTQLLKGSIMSSKATVGKIPGYYVAGKTGTSRKPNPNGKGYLSNALFTSFVGYFPVDDPKVLVMVVIDSAQGGEVWGSTVAGPVFNNIAVETARYLGLKKDKPE